jgi:hypothetical protein
MPRVPGAKDVILQPFWDSASVTSTSTTVTMFQTPKGQGSTVWGSSGSKTLEDTNMSLAGQFGSGWQFTAYTIQFQPGPATSVADLKILLAGGSLEFVVGAKTYLELPLIYAGAGAGIHGAAATTDTATTVQAWNNGVPEPKNVFGLGELPISIMENENFSVKLTWGTLGSLSGTVKFRVFLNGQLSRGVQ